MGNRHPIRAILFDYGGVVAYEGFGRALELLAQRHGLEPEALKSEAMATMYDCGYLLGRGTATQFWQQLAARTGVGRWQGDPSALVLERFVLRPGMLTLVRTLRHCGYRTAILSDQTDWLRQLDARQQFSRHFEAVFNSYELGRGKRDPLLFRTALSQLGLRPHQALFIDDREGHVQRARATGLYAVRFCSYSQLISALEKLLQLRPPLPA